METFEGEKQKRMKTNSKPKKMKWTGKRKIHFEETEYDLPTDID
jgi:ribosomal protein L24E